MKVHPAAVLDVNVRTVQRMKADKQPVPEGIAKIVRARVKRQAGD